MRDNPRERVVPAGYPTTGVTGHSAGRLDLWHEKDGPSSRRGDLVSATPEAATWDRLRAIIAEILEMDVTENDVDSSFYEDLGVSSLEKVAIVTRVENEFAVTLTDTEAASMTSLRSAGAVLSDKRLSDKVVR
jgi:acyl carrier protein